MTAIGSAKIELRAIGDDDVEAVGRFFREHLNARIPAHRWHAVMRPPWAAASPNHGFQLVGPDGIVGAYAAVYAERERGGAPVRFCNLAAFCVREDHRVHSIRLLRAMLSQPGFVFTDLSPSGAVVGLDRRLGFTDLDTATDVTPNLPHLPRRGIRVTERPDVLRAILRGADAVIHRDHERAAATRHVVVTSGDDYGYLVVRPDRRRGVRAFASPLYAGGDPDLLRSAWPAVGAHLLTRQGLAFTLAERRVLGFRVGPGVLLRNPRPKLFRGDIAAEDIDYLYSELALLEW